MNESLSKNASVKQWIDDFIASNNERFKGKSKAQRIKMALGAYYSSQRNESVSLYEDNISENVINKAFMIGRLHGRIGAPKLDMSNMKGKIGTQTIDAYNHGYDHGYMERKTARTT